MKKLCHPLNRDEFWENYWKEVGRDEDHIVDTHRYPLFPVDGHLSKEMRILEAGCGLGRVLKHYHYQGFSIVGIEYDRYCVETLQKEDPALPVLHASITDLPFPDRHFDVAMAFGVVGHLEKDWEKALAELRRVLRPGGLLAASLCIHNLGREMFDLLNRLKNGGAGTHFYTWLFEKNELPAILLDRGFTLLEHHPVTSREHLYNIPFLRKKGTRASHREARKSEDAYALNLAGRGAYALMDGLMPWQFCFTSSLLARRR